MYRSVLDISYERSRKIGGLNGELLVQRESSISEMKDVKIPYIRSHSPLLTGPAYPAQLHVWRLLLKRLESFSACRTLPELDEVIRRMRSAENSSVSLSGAIKRPPYDIQPRYAELSNPLKSK